jgi:hypothetical protein
VASRRTAARWLAAATCWCGSGTVYRGRPRPLMRIASRIMTCAWLGTGGAAIHRRVVGLYLFDYPDGCALTLRYALTSLITRAERAWRLEDICSKLGGSEAFSRDAVAGDQMLWSRRRCAAQSDVTQRIHLGWSSSTNRRPLGNNRKGEPLAIYSSSWPLRLHQCAAARCATQEPYPRSGPGRESPPEWEVW